MNFVIPADKFDISLSLPDFNPSENSGLLSFFFLISYLPDCFSKLTLAVYVDFEKILGLILMLSNLESQRMFLGLTIDFLVEYFPNFIFPPCFLNF